MQFMFTSLWHIKAQQVHKKKKCSDPTRLSCSSFFVFLKQLHISPSQEKRGQLMWRWWGFFVFVLFFSVPFSQPLWHNPRKNSRHFRHDGRTISETLWDEAEQPSKRLVQSKERLQPLGGRLSNERSTGKTFFIWITVRYGNLKKSVCRCPRLIFYLTDANISWKFT